jgi:hypothetical protein
MVYKKHTIQNQQDLLIRFRICVAAVEALRKKKRQDETQFTTKIGGKTSLAPSYYFISFPVTRLMPYYAETGQSLSPPNCLTLSMDNSSM